MNVFVCLNSFRADVSGFICLLSQLLCPLCSPSPIGTKRHTTTALMGHVRAKLPTCAHQYSVLTRSYAYIHTKEIIGFAQRLLIAYVIY